MMEEKELLITETLAMLSFLKDNKQIDLQTYLKCKEDALKKINKMYVTKNVA